MLGDTRMIITVHNTKTSGTSQKISWSGVPPTAKSLALVMNDEGGIHYIIYNIPSNIQGLDGHAENKGLPEQAIVANNPYKEEGYSHDVYLVALRTVLSSSLADRPGDLLKEIWKHNIDMAVLLKK